MLGHGRFRWMTKKLSGPGVPVGGGERFSSRLFKSCGCRLAWHRMRRVFVIYRQRGKFQPIQTFCDIGNEHYPFNNELLREATNVVRWADAKMSGDADRMLDEYRRIDKQRTDRDTAEWISDAWPEYKKDLYKFHKMLHDGRVTSKYFQVTAS